MDENSEKNNSANPDSNEVQGHGISLLLPRLKTFESFKTAGYRIFFCSLVGQWAAMSMQMMARSLLVYRITGSGASIGILALAHAIPTLLIGFLGGAIADRVQKKYILVGCQVFTGVISLGVAIALSVGYLSEDNPGSWWVLILTAVGQGTMMGFMMPARMAIIPEIVGADNTLHCLSEDGAFHRCPGDERLGQFLRGPGFHVGQSDPLFQERYSRFGRDAAPHQFSPLKLSLQPLEFLSQPALHL